MIKDNTLDLQNLIGSKFIAKLFAKKILILLSIFHVKNSFRFLKNVLESFIMVDHAINVYLKQ